MHSSSCKSLCLKLDCILCFIRFTLVYGVLFDGVLFDGGLFFKISFEVGTYARGGGLFEGENSMKDLNYRKIITYVNDMISLSQE